jgi:hypothetical protein
MGRFGFKFVGNVKVLGRGLKVASLAAAMALALAPTGRSQPASTVTVAITSDFVSRSPYGDSTAQTFGIWKASQASRRASSPPSNSSS